MIIRQGRRLRVFYPEGISTTRGGVLLAEPTAGDVRPIRQPNSTLFTAEFPTYDTMAQFGYKHKRIDHHSKVYVRGNVHTNSIEGFWSLVKRGISGVYHSVSPQYLQSYLNEYAFRYNHRKSETPMFKAFLYRIS